MSDERNGCPSASNAHRYANCPGSHAACDGIPDETSEDAALGNEVHDILAGIRRDASPEAEELARQCSAQEHYLLDAFLVLNPNAAHYSTVREKRIWARAGDYSWSGKPDVVHYCAAHGLVIDYKTGRGDVEDAKSNMQLRWLAVLAAREYGLDRVTVAIVQPLAGKPTTCTYDADDLLRAEQEANAIVEVLYPDGRNTRRPGEWCKYCRARGTNRCEESMAPTLAITQREQVQQGLFNPAVAAAWLAHCEIAEGAIAAYRKLAKAHLEAGGTIPGWRLKPGATVAKITAPEVVFGRFADAGGTAEEFTRCVTVRKGDLTKALGRLRGLKGKALDEAMDDLLDGAVTETQNAPSLARDKGDA